MKKEALSKSMEDYLETVLILSKINGEARISDIAEKLNISKPSVTEAIDKLSQDGYVYKEKYKPVSLTEKGKKLAEEVFCKHNIIKEFLINVVGVNSEVAEEDACKMEHVVSDNTLEKLYTILEKENYINKIDVTCKQYNNQ